MRRVDLFLVLGQGSSQLLIAIVLLESILRRLQPLLDFVKLVSFTTMLLKLCHQDPDFLLKSQLLLILTHI